ncbi:hypothetical protein VOLCADRAFT_98874 [Volvox carteri f. nagariensis]|uniref:Phospholipid/glycerol acyltransferase domain-containing protein n=1 Tax=Volvox carteri f. nagariensis TaxID=3068 RepID=D8UGI3_VOLCA|nr:uncharacterized protein VOLCADRAFT_98874 [Volvox carteri f. nagariensis]EFJ41206.1 hypothetical protein VOLCADRAFT_98874 [Volvox carteri f. nagariensis]|eukprot:XP_002957774.1 hypothetical protein VOLCADRAFT_98874 [Volvox carteri f. nagariensis]
MSVPSKALSLPSFLFSVFVFYWSLPLFAIIYRIRFANVGKRNDMLDWWMVFFAFPVFCTSVLILRGIVLFKRGHIADKELLKSDAVVVMVVMVVATVVQAFNVWLDATLRKSTVPGLLVYPEGHRSLKPRSLPLKRGMLHFAFSRHLAVQLVITRGKEEVMSEKTCSARWGRTLVTNYSKVCAGGRWGGVIKPTDFDSFDAFFNEIQTTWDACWQLSYHQPIAGVPRLSLKDAHEYDYPPSMRWLQLGVTLLSIVILAAVLYGSWVVLRAGVLSLGSSVTQQAVVVLGGAGGWLGLSLLRSFL